MVTLVIFLLAIVISARISVSSQHETEFWIDCLGSNSPNESAESREFRIAYESDDDVRQFVRVRTVVPQAVVVALTYAWVVVFLLGAPWHCRRDAEFHGREFPESEKEPVSEPAHGVETVDDLSASESYDAMVSPAPEEEEEEEEDEQAEDSRAQPEKAVQAEAKSESSHESDPSAIIEVLQSPPTRAALPPGLTQIEIDPPPPITRPTAPYERYWLDDGVLSLSESSESYSEYGYWDMV
jgi:hypothetical protein